VVKASVAVVLFPVIIAFIFVEVVNPVPPCATLKVPVILLAAIENPVPPIHTTD